MAIDPQPSTWGRAPGLMVCGTTSNAGKTTLVAALCRSMARRGLRVAPFKAQNMALNSAVTRDGHEIGRAQFLQAQAARVEPEVAMNPILLKPTSDRTAQVVIDGKPHATIDAATYHEAKPELLEGVLTALDDLRSRFDVVVCEGAGSPAEINLIEHDIVNLRIAAEAGLPALLVGDIDLGGVFAALYGTVELLPAAQRAQLIGFVLNKFRGDPALLGDGLDQLEALTGVPTVGVVPMLDGLRLDAEDSMALGDLPPPAVDAALDVAVICLPRISNFTDVDPLLAEPDVAVRFVRSTAELGAPDLVIIPGSKATCDDLAWLRSRGLDAALHALVEAGSWVLGVCAGFQIMGTEIDDDVESNVGCIPGLGLLPVTTRFEREKVLGQRRAHVVAGGGAGAEVVGYEIHHGRVDISAGRSNGACVPWICDEGSEALGVRSGTCFGTTLHGLFDADAARRGFLLALAHDRGVEFVPADIGFAEVREAALDRLADSVEEHVDLSRIGAAMGLAL